MKELRLATFSGADRHGWSYAIRGQCKLPARPVVMVIYRKPLIILRLQVNPVRTLGMVYVFLQDLKGFI